MHLKKTVGNDQSILGFHRLPKAVAKAREVFMDRSVRGFLLCTLLRPPCLNGLLFCDDKRVYPDGLPIQTRDIAEHHVYEGYDVFSVEGGDIFVVTHWLHDNGAIDCLNRVH